jgi:hypothetical protein
MGGEAQRWREQRSACSRLVRWVQRPAIHIMAIMAILMDIMQVATGHIGMDTIIGIIGIMPIGAPTAIMLITVGFIQDGVLDTSATAITGGTVIIKIIKPSRGFIF